MATIKVDIKPTCRYQSTTHYILRLVLGSWQIESHIFCPNIKRLKTRFVVVIQWQKMTMYTIICPRNNHYVGHHMNLMLDTGNYSPHSFNMVELWCSVLIFLMYRCTTVIPYTSRPNIIVCITFIWWFYPHTTQPA